MTGTINSVEASDKLFVLGETLRPVLTNAIGSPDLPGIVRVAANHDIEFVS